MEQLAHVYARSLFELANEEDRLDAVRDDLAAATEAVAASRELQQFFFAPFFSPEEKREAVGRVFTGADPLLEGFLGVLAENHRMPVIFRARKAFDQLWREQRKRLPVAMRSATKLDDQIVERLSARIAELTGKEVELSVDVEPELIGGFVLRVGNSILDASVRNRLARMRRELAAA